MRNGFSEPGVRKDCSHGRIFVVQVRAKSTATEAVDVFGTNRIYSREIREK